MSQTPIYDQLVREFKQRQQQRNPIMDDFSRNEAKSDKPRVNLKKTPTVKALSDKTIGDSSQE